MPVEQGLPWHPVATGLAGRAIPFVVAASHGHAPPSAPFWFPVPAVLGASPALLCPSSLSAVLALVPPGVAPAFCVSVLLPPAPPAPPPPPRGIAGTRARTHKGHTVSPSQLPPNHTAYLWTGGEMTLTSIVDLVICGAGVGCGRGCTRRAPHRNPPFEGGLRDSGDVIPPPQNREEEHRHSTTMQSNKTQSAQLFDSPMRVTSSTFA